MTPEVKALLDWLNVYAFVGWILFNTDYYPEEVAKMKEEQPEKYEELLNKFQADKMKVIEKAKSEADHE